MWRQFFYQISKFHCFVPPPSIILPSQYTSNSDFSSLHNTINPTSPSWRCLPVYVSLDSDTMTFYPWSNQQQVYFHQCFRDSKWCNLSVSIHQLFSSCSLGLFAVGNEVLLVTSSCVPLFPFPGWRKRLLDPVLILTLIFPCVFADPGTCSFGGITAQLAKLRTGTCK